MAPEEAFVTRRPLLGRAASRGTAIAGSRRCGTRGRDPGAIGASGWLALCSAALSLVTAAAASEPGSFDRGFGQAGHVLTDFRSGSDDRARELLLQSDGKILAVGSSGPPGGAAHGHIAIARYLPDGRLDPSYGSEGKVLADFGGPGLGAALQRDGRLVVVGVSDASGQQDFALARFRTDGSLDPSFGVGGKVFTDVSPRPSDLDYAYAVSVQQNGKIVAVGQTTLPGGSGRDFALVRYEATGILDQTFGSKGKVVTNLSRGSDDSALAVALQRDGKIVVGGSGGVEGHVGFALARYLPDGRLDRSFRRGGVALDEMGFSGFGEVRALVVQSDNSITAAGWGYVGETRTALAVARYRVTGTRDSRFGTGGKVLAGLSRAPDEGAFAAALQRDGKLLVGGGSGGDLFVARYRGDGALDTTFGGTGFVASDLGHNEYASAIAVQADARILAAGGSESEEGSDFAIVRYLSRGRPGTRVAALTATMGRVGAIVRWQTVAEVGTRGFNVYRLHRGDEEETTGKARRVLVNRRLIRSNGGRKRRVAYSLVDRRVPRDPASEVSYLLQEVKRDGSTRWFFKPIVLES